MSLSLTIETTGSISGTLESAGPMTAGEYKGVAAEVARLVQRHLRNRDSSNAHAYPTGGRRSHFWQQAAQAVSFSGSEESGAQVVVAQLGARLRYAGAPDGIRPVNAGALAIPADAESYGKLPREFPDLSLVVFGKGAGNKAALVRRAIGGQKRSKNSDGSYTKAVKPQDAKILFWLVRQTKPVPPDPTVLPPENVILGLAMMRLLAMRARSGH